MSTRSIKSIIYRIRFNQKASVFMVCAFIATVFWIFTSLSRTYESHLSLPVRYAGLPFARFPSTPLPTRVDFLFRGSGFELTRLYMRNIPDSIVIDLSHSSGYPGAVNLSTVLLREQLPGDLKPVHVAPQRLITQFTLRLTRRVPVRLVHRFSFSPRFALSTRPVILPDSVDVAGPPDLLVRVREITTQVVSLEDIHHSRFGAIAIDTTVSRGLTVSVPYVFYYIPVEEFTEGVVDLPVELPVAQRGRVTLLPGSVRLRYLAPLTRFATIRPSDFRVTAQVPFPEFPDELAVSVVQAPYGVKGINVTPGYIDYLVAR